eukprot:2272243-Pyramimonas_sp.AAC.1
MARSGPVEPCATSDPAPSPFRLIIIRAFAPSWHSVAHLGTRRSSELCHPPRLQRQAPWPTGASRAARVDGAAAAVPGLAAAAPGLVASGARAAAEADGAAEARARAESPQAARARVRRPGGATAAGTPGRATAAGAMPGVTSGRRRRGS